MSCVKCGQEIQWWVKQELLEVSAEGLHYLAWQGRAEVENCCYSIEKSEDGNHQKNEESAKDEDYNVTTNPTYENVDDPDPVIPINPSYGGDTLNPEELLEHADLLNANCEGSGDNHGEVEEENPFLEVKHKEKYIEANLWREKDRERNADNFYFSVQPFDDSVCDTDKIFKLQPFEGKEKDQDPVTDFQKHTIFNFVDRDCKDGDEDDHEDVFTDIEIEDLEAEKEDVVDLDKLTCKDNSLLMSTIKYRSDHKRMQDAGNLDSFSELYEEIII